jgi:hypothetical protein
VIASVAAEPPGDATTLHRSNGSARCAPQTRPLWNEAGRHLIATMIVHPAKDARTFLDDTHGRGCRADRRCRAREPRVSAQSGGLLAIGLHKRSRSCVSGDSFALSFVEDALLEALPQP